MNPTDAENAVAASRFREVQRLAGTDMPIEPI